MTTHVLAGLGTYADVYSPPITESTQEYNISSYVVFTPAILAAVPPLVLLLSASLSGSSVESCTGPITNPQSTGTLTWSDGTTSSISLVSLTGERVEGHPICHSTWHVTSGHFTGGTVNTLAVALASNLTACLTGGSISTASGAVVFIVTMP
ncbi:hypothetical protein ACFXKC_55625 [Streptomyces sp. NPDC059340]|uniref:hypothetical protein n=1 Tax=Streptomyces sp. NPDC059340 TaxID=3346806 RepID=UPI00369E199F